MSGDSNVYYKNRTSQLYNGTITLMVLVNISVVARLLGSRIYKAGYWWDDYLITLALVKCSTIVKVAKEVLLMISRSSAGDCLCARGLLSDLVDLVVIPRYTVGLWGLELFHSESSIFFKLSLSIQILYFASTLAIKTSLVLVYYRILGLSIGFKCLLAISWILVFIYSIVDLFVANL